MVTGLIVLAISLVLFGILVMIVALFGSKGEADRERETIQAYIRAAETKRLLDAQAFKAAQDIQEAVRRHGGNRG